MLTQIFAVKDNIDQLILSEICNPSIFQLKVEEVVFWGDKKRKDMFFKSIMGVTQALLKANEHVRKYQISERDKIAEINIELKISQGTSDIGYNPVELNGEIDAFLVQIKSALDQLATVLNPLFGIKLGGWNKVKNKESGKIESGFGVLSSLRNNLPNNKNQESKKLIDLVEKNISWLSYIVLLRDDPVHCGGAKNITPVFFNKNDNMIINQRIIHDADNIEDVLVFMNRTMNEMIWFINNFVFFFIRNFCSRSFVGKDI